MEIQRWTDLVVAPIRLAAWLGLSSSDIVGVIVAPIARFAKSTVLVPFPRHWRASRRRGPAGSRQDCLGEREDGEREDDRDREDELLQRHCHEP